MATIRQGAAPEDNFTLIPNDLSRSVDIPPRAKAVYIYLKSHRDGWNVTVNHVADALGMSRNTVGSALIDLENHGYIIREQSREAKGTFDGWDYRVLSYPVPVSQNLGDGDPLPKIGCTPSQKLGSGSDQQEQCINAGGDQSPNFGGHKKTITTKKTKREDPPYSPPFIQFYERYPRKGSKREAQRAFDKALERTTFEEIMAGVDAYASDPNRDPGFTKLPATWLNKECWDDEPLPPRRGGGASTNAPTWEQLDNTIDEMRMNDWKQIG